MSTVSEAGNAGQVADLSTMTTEEALRSIAASLAALTAALITPENDGDAEDEGTRPDPAAPPPPIALGHLALRDDGAVLLSIEDCEGRDLSGRELVTCIVLTPQEVLAAHESAHDAFSGAAATAAGTLPWKAEP